MNGWSRVTKASPCPVCQKPDWCTVGSRFICCMRVPSERQVANGGYLHPLDAKSQTPIPRQRPEPPTINTTAIMSRWRSTTTPTLITQFAHRLRLPASSLVALEVAYAPDHYAWAFPMKDGYGNPCGIRLRDNAGRKWAVTGSRQGIFLPTTPPQSTAYICEGPTDTAAAVALGLFALGRPSCSGAEAHIITAVRRLNISRAIILSDNDSPGLAGAYQLSQSLPIPSCIMVPPAKDIRQFLALGGTPDLLDSLANSLVWHQPEK